MHQPFTCVQSRCHLCVGQRRLRFQYSNSVLAYRAGATYVWANATFASMSQRWLACRAGTTDAVASSAARPRRHGAVGSCAGQHQRGHQRRASLAVTIDVVQQRSTATLCLRAEPVPRTRSLHQLPGRADMGPSAVVLDNTNVVTNAALRSPSPMTSVDPAFLPATPGAHSDEHIGVNAPPLPRGGPRCDASTSVLLRLPREPSASYLGAHSDKHIALRGPWVCVCASTFCCESHSLLHCSYRCVLLIKALCCKNSLLHCSSLGSCRPALLCCCFCCEHQAPPSVRAGPRHRHFRRAAMASRWSRSPRLASRLPGCAAPACRCVP